MAQWGLAYEGGNPLCDVMEIVVEMDLYSSSQKPQKSSSILITCIWCSYSGTIKKTNVNGRNHRKY